MRVLTKIFVPSVLAVSLVAIAGCDSASQAQTAQTQTAQTQTGQVAAAQVDTAQIETGQAVKLTSAAEPAETLAQKPDVLIWQVDADKSHLKFSARQESDAFDGEFKNFTAVIKFHPDNLEASLVSVTVPLSGVDAGSTDRNSTLPGKTWFSIKKFPDAVFTAKVFKPMGDGAYEALGELTIKGVSRELSLPFTLDIEDGTAIMRSMVQMDRTNWNVGEAPWNTDEWVSKAVKLDIVVTAKAVE